MPDEQPQDDLQSSPSFGWTSSRATHVYFVWHAPCEEMLEHFGIEPIPDTPPPDLGERR